jgi:pyruvate dehydrogenase E1 component alpha subunit
MSAAAASIVTREHALDLLAKMLRIRCFEDRCAELYSAGKIRGFLHLYNGEEAIAVAMMQALRPEDAVVGTYREHGHALARGVSMRAVMAELFGKQTGCCRGRGGSMHLFDASNRFYGGNAIVASCLPLAVGLGLAEKLQGRSGIAVCFFGEGAIAEGEFHESMNLASLWSIPILFVCENNFYAMGTALSRSEAESDLVKKASSYRMRAQAVDGMDIFAVEAVAEELVSYVRKNRAPAFLEAKTYRFRAHSMYDPQLYRDKAEIKQWEEKGPLISLTRRLKAQQLMTEEDFLRLQQAAIDEVEDAIAFADSSLLEPVAELERHVYAEVSA